MKQGSHLWKSCGRFGMGLLMAAALLNPQRCQTAEVEAVKPTPSREVAEHVLPALGADWVPLSKDERCWMNRKIKQVAIDGEVCLTRGYLEMFACIKNTKEHESIVGLDSKAFVIHTALLAVGAKSGSPSTWRPEYKPATGTTIEVIVEWVHSDGKVKTARAQEWIRDITTQKPMAHDWVFGGSSMWQDPETKRRYYRAEGGELICVSNFPTAMMDLPIESSQANDELAFEALTEKIPPRRTPVRVYLIPKLKPSKK